MGAPSLPFTGRVRREAAGVGLAQLHGRRAGIDTLRRSDLGFSEKVARRLADRNVDADMPVEVERGGKGVSRGAGSGHGRRLPSLVRDCERQAGDHFRARREPFIIWVPLLAADFR